MTKREKNHSCKVWSEKTFLSPGNNSGVAAESLQQGGELQRSILSKIGPEEKNQFGTCRFFLHTLTAAKASCICFLRASLCRLYAISMKMRKIPATMPPATSMKTPEDQGKLRQQRSLSCEDSLTHTVCAKL